MPLQNHHSRDRVLCHVRNGGGDLLLIGQPTHLVAAAFVIQAEADKAVRGKNLVPIRGRAGHHQRIICEGIVRGALKARQQRWIQIHIRLLPSDMVAGCRIAVQHLDQLQILLSAGKQRVDVYILR